MSSLLIHNKFWGLIACYGFDLDHSLWSMKWFLQVTRIQQLNCTRNGSDLLNHIKYIRNLANYQGNIQLLYLYCLKKSQQHRIPVFGK